MVRVSHSDVSVANKSALIIIIILIVANIAFSVLVVIRSKLLCEHQHDESCHQTKRHQGAVEKCFRLTLTMKCTVFRNNLASQL